MQYDAVIEGIFIRRVNRFIAHVLVGGSEEVVHVKNTGRCRELLIEGVTVILEVHQNPARKTAFSLIAVYKGDRLINMDSQAPNQVAAEALKAGLIQEIGKVNLVKREKTFGGSRFDLYYEQGERKGFIEVKGVTLEDEGVVRFPDAPTTRGTKHIEEMMLAVREGYAGCLLFLVQMDRVRYMAPNEATDPAFAEALRCAFAAGVQIIAYDTAVQPNSMVMGSPVPVQLEAGRYGNI